MAMNADNPAVGAAIHDAQSSALREEVDLLKSDLSRIKEDLGLIAGTMKGKAQARVHSAKEEVQERFHSGIDAVEQYVEDKPLTTVLVAFGIGLLLGKVFSLK